MHYVPWRCTDRPSEDSTVSAALTAGSFFILVIDFVFSWRTVSHVLIIVIDGPVAFFAIFLASSRSRPLRSVILHCKEQYLINHLSRTGNRTSLWATKASGILERANEIVVSGTYHKKCKAF
jgi:hypothetical protein